MRSCEKKESFQREGQGRRRGREDNTCLVVGVVVVPLDPLIVIPIHVLAVPDRKLFEGGREGGEGGEGGEA
jgi:hypothetical protein